MAFTHSNFPQWGRLDHSRGARRTLTVTMAAITGGMIAGASAIAFLMMPLGAGLNLSPGATESSNFGVDRRVTDQSDFERLKLPTVTAGPVVAKEMPANSAPQQKPPVERHPTGQSSASAIGPSSDDAAPAQGRQIEPGKRNHGSAAHVHKNYRMKFGGFFSPFPNRNRRWFSMPTRNQSNLSPL